MAEQHSSPMRTSPKTPVKNEVSKGVSPKTPVNNEVSISVEGRIGSPCEQHRGVDINSPTNTHKIIAEVMGTYVLIFAGCGAVIMNQTITIVGVSVVWGLAVLVMVYTLGHVSGSHFNPAITFAFAVSCMFPWKQVPLYIGSQITGSILAILTLNMLFNGQQVQQHDFHISITMTKFDTSYFHAIMWEFIISFILMFVVCGVATDHRGINELSGVAVGATVLLNILIAGPTTGASMNPARSIGPALVSHEFKQLWVYIVAPVLGTTAATAVYCLIRVPVSDKSDIASKSA